MAAVPWQEYTLDKQTVWSWQIGNVHLSVQHQDTRWLVSYEHRLLAAAQKGRAEIKAKVSNSQKANQQYFHFPKSVQSLRLLPQLPNRNYIALFHEPLTLLPGTESSLFISLPISISIQLPESGLQVCEFPAEPLKEAWLGTSTQVGELVYAGYPTVHTLENAIVCPQDHAIVPIKIYNRSKHPLKVLRLQLPVTSLALFQTSAGNLWTPLIKLTNKSLEKPIEVDVQEKPYRAELKLLTAARSRIKPYSFLQALNNLFI